MLCSNLESIAVYCDYENLSPCSAEQISLWELSPLYINCSSISVSLLKQDYLNTRQGESMQNMSVTVLCFLSVLLHYQKECGSL